MTIETMKKTPEIEKIWWQLKDLRNEVENIAKEMQKWKEFWWITLQKNWKYEIPWISNSAKNIKHKQFPGVIFGDCKLSKKLWSVVFSDSLVVPKN